MIPALARGLWLALGAAVLVLPLLPLPQWSGAPDQGPIWLPHVASWGIGIVTVAGGALIAGRLAVRIRPAGMSWPAPGAGVTVGGLAILLTAASVVVMRVVFAANPHLVDEIAQLFHARVLAAGHLAAPPPEPPAAFLATHTWITSAGWTSQYPPGHTVLLTFGLLARGEWLVNPVLGGVSLVLVYLVGRGLYGRRTGIVAAVLWALSSWVLFMSGTYMNHVSAVTLALAAWALVLAPRHPRVPHFTAAGCALAACAATRPLDAVAAAVPVLVWLAARRRIGALPWMIAGGLPVMAAWGWLNWRIYGSPLTLGYSAVYGAEHGLGFHGDPWGQPYTPLTALSNMAIAIRRLHIYLYEWPIPALLPLAAWAVFGRQRAWPDVVVVTAIMAAPLLYFFYWHSGFYIGPRFYYAAAPMLVIGTARAWRVAWMLARRAKPRRLRWDVAVSAAALFVVLWGWVGILPIRWDAYRGGLATLKRHPERELARLGVRSALVLIPESLGSRIGVRLWALGIPPGLVERAYRRLDTCDLFLWLRSAETAEWRGDVAAARLQATLDSVTSVPPLEKTWPDPTVRFRRGYTPPEACQVELRRDLAGFTLYGYLVWRNAVGLDRGIVFARDLYELNEPLLARYAGWEVWRYAPPPDRPGELPVLTRLRGASGAPTS
ncbi:MAG: glycosyltransferase family 39 protein [Gemmatimonadetes bacterium]|nr:glycosyltransferase family 39 protein [Gemmatimonadota bacterium]